MSRVRWSDRARRSSLAALIGVPVLVAVALAVLGISQVGLAVWLGSQDPQVRLLAGQVTGLDGASTCDDLAGRCQGPDAAPEPVRPGARRGRVAAPRQLRADRPRGTEPGDGPALAARLDVPLREPDGPLPAAGCTPVYGERDLGTPDLEPLRQALDLILAGHEPSPAIVVDRRCKPLAGTRAVGLLTARLAPALLEPPSAHHLQP